MSFSVICEIMTIKADFRIFVNASHSVFLRKANKIKTKFFFENRVHTFFENLMMLTCAKIQGKV